MTVSENLAHARMAIDHVKKTLWLGSANKGKDYLPVWAGGKGGFNLAGVIAQRTFSPTSANAGPEKVAATAETYRSGNCDEKSAVAYVFLKKLGVRPLDWMKLNNGDHAFVLIQPRPATTHRQPAWRPGGSTRANHRAAIPSYRQEDNGKMRARAPSPASSTR